MDKKILLIILIIIGIFYINQYTGPCLAHCYKKYDLIFIMLVFILGFLIGNYKNKKE